MPSTLSGSQSFLVTGDGLQLSTSQYRPSKRIAETIRTGKLRTDRERVPYRWHIPVQGAVVSRLRKSKGRRGAVVRPHFLAQRKGPS